MEQVHKAVTISGSYRVEMVSMDAGACPCWVWPESAIPKIRKGWTERRKAVFSAAASQYLGAKKKRRKRPGVEFLFQNKICHDMSKL